MHGGTFLTFLVKYIYFVPSLCVYVIFAVVKVNVEVYSGVYCVTCTVILTPDQSCYNCFRKSTFWTNTMIISELCSTSKDRAWT